MRHARCALPAATPAHLVSHYSAEKELEDARLLFETINEQLLTELPQLLELRIPYLDPSFEAMVRMQARFAEEGYEKMGAVQRYFAEGIREEYAEGQLDAQVRRLCRSEPERNADAVATRVCSTRSRAFCRRCGSCRSVALRRLERRAVPASIASTRHPFSHASLCPSARLRPHIVPSPRT